LAYGFGLAILIVLLKYLEYSFFIKYFSHEFYFGIIALSFLIIGIWAGVKWIGSSSSKKNIRWNGIANKKVDLSNRELKVLVAMQEGLSNKQIAEKLFLSENTIKTHAANLYSKLDVKRRTQALKMARELGLIE